MHFFFSNSCIFQIHTFFKFMFFQIHTFFKFMFFSNSCIFSNSYIFQIHVFFKFMHFFKFMFFQIHVFFKFMHFFKFSRITYFFTEFRAILKLPCFLKNSPFKVHFGIPRLTTCKKAVFPYKISVFDYEI